MSGRSDPHIQPWKRPMRSLIKSLRFQNKSDDLVRERFQTLATQIPTMYLVVLLNTFFLGHVMANSVGYAMAYRVPEGLMVVMCARIIVWSRRRRRSRDVTIAQMQRAMRGTVVVAAFIALVLSIWTILLLDHAARVQQSYIPLFASLSTVSCAACLLSIPLAAYVVLIGATLPISIALILTGDLALATMALNLLIMAPLMLGMVARQFRQLKRVVESRSEIEVERAKVGELAYRDPLTSLPNRRAFLQELEVSYSGGSEPDLAVAMIDLDRFKMINDTYGHHIGDGLLIEAARRLREGCAEHDLVARLGGDEFAVLLRDVGGVEIAEARIAAISGCFDDPFILGTQTFQLSASIGIAHRSSNSGDASGLLNRADIALFEAKQQGQVISVFRPLMEERLRRRLQIERALSNSTECALIELHYQPVFETMTSDISGFEALARWTHPILGIVSPTEFVSVAEQCGMTDRLTAQLFVMALDAATLWPTAYGLSFNLSAAELTSPGVAQMLLLIMKNRDFDPRRLSIEVTETALLRDFENAREALSVLRQSGIRILLDDFGAGYASIGYLREIQFDGIKLDGSLIAHITEDAIARQLLVGVLQLCRAIGLPVTAEMVENKLQWEILRSLRVEKLQGFYLARPKQLNEILVLCADVEVPPRLAIAG